MRISVNQIKKLLSSHTFKARISTLALDPSSTPTKHSSPLYRTHPFRSERLLRRHHRCKPHGRKSAAAHRPVLQKRRCTRRTQQTAARVTESRLHVRRRRNRLHRGDTEF